MQEVDIPDIFDVLEGGEDESAVKYLLGFGGGDGGGSGATAAAPISVPVGVSVSAASLRAVPATSPSSSSSSKLESGNGEEVRRGPGGRLVRKRDTTGLRAIYACNCCSKAFTTKFNLRRHINLHCNVSKEVGVPLQGPPSAHFVSKKSTGNKIVSSLQPAAPGTGVLPVIKKAPAPTVVAAAASQPITAPVMASAPLLRLAPSGPPSQAPSFSLSPHPIGASSDSSAGGATVKVLHDLNGCLAAGNNSFTPISYSSPSSRPSAGGLVITATSAPSAVSSTASMTPSASSSAAEAAVHLPSKGIPMLPSSIVASSSSSTALATHLPSFTVSVAVAPAASSPASNISPAATAAAAGGDAVQKTIFLTSSTNANGLATDSFDGANLGAASPAPALPMETDSSTTKCIEFIVAKIPSPPPPPPLAAAGSESDPLLYNCRPRKSKVSAFPDGWVRKAVWANEEYSVFYFNRNGKKFASLGEVVDYFDRLDRDVDDSLFDFLPTRQEVDDIRESRRRERESELEAAQRTSPFSLCCWIFRFFTSVNLFTLGQE